MNLLQKITLATSVVAALQATVAIFRSTTTLKGKR